MTPEVSDYAREVTDFVVSVPRRVHALGESIYDQKPPNPKKIDTKGFLTDSGRICHVK